MASSAMDKLLAEPTEPTPAGTTVDTLRAAVEVAPDDAEAHRKLGLVLRHTAAGDEALAHLERAVELAPHSVRALMSLGITYSSRRRLADAEAIYLRILEASPEHPKALNNLGNLALRRGDEEDSTAWYLRAVEANPDYLLAQHKLAGVYEYFGHLDRAYPVYERVLELAPQTPAETFAFVDSLYKLGSINLTREEYELAERLLARVIQIVPDHRSAHYARAQALTQLGRGEEALHELQVHMNVLVASGEGF